MIQSRAISVDIDYPVLVTGGSCGHASESFMNAKRPNNVGVIRKFRNKVYVESISRSAWLLIPPKGSYAQEVEDNRI